MASVDLDTLWLNDAEDLSDYMSFPLMSALTVTTKVEGQQRRRAAGRLVFVRRAGTAATFAARLRYCDREQIEWLEVHIGRLLLVRDDRGRKTFAVYSAVPVAEIGHLREGDVDLELAEVTSSEAV